MTVIPGLGFAAAALGAMLPATGPSRPVPAISREVIILMVRGHHLSVFQDLVVGRPSSGPMPVALLTGARDVRALTGTVSSSGVGRWQIKTTGQHAALHYLLPWNGRSASLSLTGGGAVRTTILLAEPGLEVPPLLNPSLARVGQGKVPHVPASPIFDEYASRVPWTANRLTLDIEQRSRRPVTRASRWVGNATLAAIGFVLAVGLAQVLYWPPSEQRQSPRKRDER